mgnify:CR=1 FL=1
MIRTFENPDFNQWTTSDEVEPDTSIVDTGQYSMKMTDTPPANYVTLSCNYNHRLTGNLPAGFFARVNTSNLQSMMVSIIYYSGPGNQNEMGQQTQNIQPANNSEWQTIYFDLEIPEGAGGFSLTLTIRGSGTRVGVAYIDNMDIIEWDPWHENNGQSHLSPNAFYYIQLQKTGEQNTALVSYQETAYRPIELETDEQFSPVVPDIKLYQNYPNPFNPKTTIHFSLGRDAKIKLDIYNIKGQKVISLLNSELQSGEHFVSWSGENAFGQKSGSGIYFFVLRSGDRHIVRKMLLLK